MIAYEARENWLLLVDMQCISSIAFPLPHCSSRGPHWGCLTSGKEPVLFWALFDATLWREQYIKAMHLTISSDNLLGHSKRWSFSVRREVLLTWDIASRTWQITLMRPFQYMAQKAMTTKHIKFQYLEYWMSRVQRAINLLWFCSCLDQKFDYTLQMVTA